MIRGVRELRFDCIIILWDHRRICSPSLTKTSCAVHDCIRAYIHYGPGISASNRNEYQKYFLEGIKTADVYG